MALTPEEQAELDGILTEPVGLSTEEDKELAALLGEEPDTISATESSVRGAAQTITAGFADEISGAVESTFTDKTYEEARDESRAAFEASREENPIAYTSGEVAGALAQGVIAGPSIKAAVGLGTLFGLGSSEEDDIEGQVTDAFVGGTLGAAGHGVGNLVGKGVSKLSRSTGKIMAEEADAFGLRAIGVWTKPARTKLSRMLSSKGMKTEAFVDAFEKEIDVNGKPLLNLTKSQEQLMEDVIERKAQLWDRDMGGILKEVDIANDQLGRKAVNPSQFANHLEQEIVDPLLNSANFDEQALGKKLLQRTEAYKEVKGDWTLMDLHAEKVKIGQKVNFLKAENNDLELNAGLRKMLTKTNDFIKDKVVSMSSDPNTIKRYVEANKKYGVLSDASVFIEDSVQAQKEGLSGSIRKALGMVGVMGGATVTGGIVGGVPGAALGMALTVASKSPKANLAMGKTLRTVGDYLSKNPTNGEYIQRLITASSRGNAAFNSELATLERKLAGFITDPGEAESLRNQVNSSTMPVRQKLSMHNQINNGKVPQEEEEQKPFFKVYQARDRDKGRKDSEL